MLTFLISSSIPTFILSYLSEFGGCLGLDGAKQALIQPEQDGVAVVIWTFQRQDSSTSSSGITSERPSVQSEGPPRLIAPA